MTSKVTALHAGQLFFGRTDRIVTTLLGSCVSVVLWDPQSRYAGICHFALPSRRDAEATASQPDARYADDCFTLFERATSERGVPLSRFTARVYGGGNLMERHRTAASTLSEEQRQPIGDNNAAAAFEHLMAHNVKIREADVGEFGYRNVRFDMGTGIASVTFTAFGGADAE